MILTVSMVAWMPKVSIMVVKMTMVVILTPYSREPAKTTAVVVYFRFLVNWISGSPSVLVWCDVFDPSSGHFNPIA